MQHDGALLLMLPSFRRCLEDDQLHAMEMAYGMRRPGQRYTSWKLDPTKIDALVQAEQKARPRWPA
ncbi:hypothetical protein SPRG_07603 [Saprolegnia parasitica CBS 223.65]|uniref:Uncharacterized protein n=1 Tax=Saprolegnia parasitica (strain CBS 223.65) TaxID=695850 RepID=A0A067C7Z2_SAPPC|nr:hypothetical protein SPRG_07603 [Saprolegnia parasitica CBS 223.65]KDO26889.1 hypothetical protein SPRG_07603 [Saprolegnia parasitica CBS 223.65]|eukprot:XP_012202278.1 hypothetical protein SPRG_07603 [Saprolegnia parasitica CBS 223.65]